MCSVRSSQPEPACGACVILIDGSLANSCDRQPTPNRTGAIRSRLIVAHWTQSDTRKSSRSAFERWITAVRSPTQTPTMREIPTSPMGVPGKVLHMTKISTSGQIGPVVGVSGNRADDSWSGSGEFTLLTQPTFGPIYWRIKAGKAQLTLNSGRKPGYTVVVLVLSKFSIPIVPRNLP